ncbi:hypothetical protein K435DRAFT_785193 [Dendrothele bispora CBS 962.96]|uniref:Uncharacterized protein n=1 Tax=Dendrothele bispora (strain CBS 962.96) TaxID=1314807 RepID=A0A4S8KYQ3_DENBC|nr:hypothetical protein K435DRAFT_785193 [Dendrothele bispora CBS 962.96]
MKQMLPRCEKWIKSSCLDQHDSVNCWIETHTRLVSPVRAVNGYPLLSRTFGLGTCVNTPSFPSPNSVSIFPLPFHFSPCSSIVEQAFDLTQDILQPSTPSHVAGLLERGLRMLIYVGDLNRACNWLGNEYWTLGSEWSGQRLW